MLKCPNCDSGLSFRQLITAETGMTTCTNCKSKLLVSGAMAALLFACTFGWIGVLAVIWFPNNLSVLLVVTALVYALCYYTAVWMFYGVTPLLDKKVSKSG